MRNDDDRPLIIPDDCPEGLRLREFYARYFERHLLANRGTGAKRNRECYRTALAYWERHTSNPPLSELGGPAGHRRLMEFRSALMEGVGLKKQPLARTTINTVMRTLYSLLGAAGDGKADGLGWIRTPKPLPQLKARRKVPQIYTTADLIRLYEACEEAKQPELEGIEPALWWRCLLATSYGTTLRRGALVYASFSQGGVRWSALDWNNRRVRIAGDKTDDERLEPLRREVIDHLDALHHAVRRVCPPPFHVFPWPHKEQALTDTIAAVWKAAEVALPKKPIHAFRKTALTAITVHYRPAQEAAAAAAEHRDTRTTEDYYLGLPAKRRAVESIPWPANWYLDDGEAAIIPFPAS